MFLVELNYETVVLLFSGLNPFIELSLMPPWVFGPSKSQRLQTSKKKKTVNPVFNEDHIM